MVSSPRIFRVSCTIFISSSEYPPEAAFQSDMTLPKSGPGNTVGVNAVPLTWAEAARSSSSTAACPLPLAAWYVETMTCFRRNARCSGARATTIWMVLQLGFAMMPFAGLRPATRFTSGTTNGTSGSIRQALELSMTVAPAAAAAGARSRDAALPALNSATWTPANASGEATVTATSAPRKRRLDPAEREEARRTRRSTGNARSSRIRTISRPTTPVAPTTATTSDMTDSLLGLCRAAKNATSDGCDISCPSSRDDDNSLNPRALAPQWRGSSPPDRAPSRGVPCKRNASVGGGVRQPRRRAGVSELTTAWAQCPREARLLRQNQGFSGGPRACIPLPTASMSHRSADGFEEIQE